MKAKKTTKQNKKIVKRSSQEKTSKNQVIRNEKGQVISGTPNPNGRPKGVLNFATKFKLALDAIAKDMGKDRYDPEKKQVIKGRKVSVEELEQMLFTKAFMLAKNGNFKFYQDIMDRVYGKPTQTIELGGIEDNKLNQKQIEAIDAEIEAWEKMWDNGDKNTNKGTKKKNSK